MSLLGRLIRALRGYPEPDTTEDLLRRVRELEAVQLEREVEWAKVKDSMLRYLKRAAAIEQRSRDRDELEGNGARDPVQATLLQMKFPPR